MANAHFCSGRSNEMRAQRATANARLQQASLASTCLDQAAIGQGSRENAPLFDCEPSHRSSPR